MSTKTTNLDMATSQHIDSVLAEIHKELEELQLTTNVAEESIKRSRIDVLRRKFLELLANKIRLELGDSVDTNVDDLEVLVGEILSINWDDIDPASAYRLLNHNTNGIGVCMNGVIMHFREFLLVDNKDLLEILFSTYERKQHITAYEPFGES